MGSPSLLFVVAAFWPKPRRAKPSQRRSWFAPPKRTTSAARIASRASRNVGPIGISSIAS
jgi:hypothetical protein